MNNSTQNFQGLNKYTDLNGKELSEVEGGIAPLFIAGGIILAGGGGFAAGYGLSRWLG